MFGRLASTWRNFLAKSWRGVAASFLRRWPAKREVATRPRGEGRSHSSAARLFLDAEDEPAKQDAVIAAHLGELNTRAHAGDDLPDAGGDAHGFVAHLDAELDHVAGLGL